jgi:hypothetical protein
MTRSKLTISRCCGAHFFEMRRVGKFRDHPTLRVRTIAE